MNICVITFARSKVKQLLETVDEYVVKVQSKTADMLSSTKTVQEEEETAESIDKIMHDLHYLVSHTRRVIQCAEPIFEEDAGDFGIELSKHSKARRTVSSAMTEQEKASLKEQLITAHKKVNQLIIQVNEAASSSSQTLNDSSKGSGNPMHLNNSTHSSTDEGSRHNAGFLGCVSISDDSMIEIDENIKDLHELLDEFHTSFRSEMSHWHHNGHHLPVTRVGDTIPPGLVITVAADAIIDGFLIGINATLSPEAGMILAAANCIEV